MSANNKTRDMNLKFNYTFGKEFKTGIPNRDTLSVKITKISSIVSVENVSQFSLTYGYVIREADHPNVYGVYTDSDGLIGYVSKYSSRKVDDFTNGVITPCLIYIYPYLNKNQDKCLRGEIRLYRMYKGEENYVDKIVDDYFDEYVTKFYSKFRLFWENVHNIENKKSESEDTEIDLHPVYKGLNKEYLVYNIYELFFLRMKKLRGQYFQFSDPEYLEIARSFNKGLCYIINKENYPDFNQYEESFKLWINMMDEDEESEAQKLSFDYLVKHYPEKEGQLKEFRDLKTRYFQLEKLLHSNITDNDEYKINKKEYKKLRHKLRIWDYRDNKMYSRAYITRMTCITLFSATFAILLAFLAFPILILCFPIFLKVMKSVRFFL